MDQLRNVNLRNDLTEARGQSPSTLESYSPTTNGPSRMDHESDCAKKQLDRPYDLIIFGASSSVGKFIVEEMALVVEKFYSPQTRQRTYAHTNSLLAKEHPDSSQQYAQTRRLSVPRSMDGIQWAVAGRSAVKLNEVLCRAELSTGIKDLSYRVPVILADLNQTRSLREMCLKTKLIVSCVGPYSHGGEELIKVCIDTKTNYIDLCHETTFIDEIREKYYEVARTNGMFIINGCGFQSMSAEMGLNFIKQVVDGQVEEVKVILNLNDTKVFVQPSSSQLFPQGIVSTGMWYSTLAEKAQQMSLTDRFRAEVSKTRSIDPDDSNNTLKSRKDTQTMVRDIVEFKNRNTLPWLNMVIGFTSNGRGYCWPLENMTSDESQMIRGEMDNYELRRPDMDSSSGWTPIRCSTYVAMKNIIEVVIVLVWTLTFSIMSRFSPARWIMRNYPYVFSLGNVIGPNETVDRDSLVHIKYCQTFIAYGDPSDSSADPLEKTDDKTRRKHVQLLVARVVGPEPNHVATATFAVQAALTLLAERDHLPVCGGVITPGAAFAETNIIYQLRRRNIKFEVLKKA